MSRELLQNVRVLDPVSESDRIADILIAEGNIKAVEEKIAEFPADTQVRDCRGLILGPGLTDIYSHSGEPGFEDRETLESLMQAAVAGGFTRVAILPDTSPPVDNLAGLALLQQHIRNLPPGPRLYFWGALTAGVKGQQMAELGELASCPVVGFADGLPLSNPALVRRLLEYIKPLGKSVALWPCDRTLAGNGAVREGALSVRLGLPGIPASAETSALAAILELVASAGTPVHIMRVSTARSVELIRDAKARGLPVTASVTWMHLLLNVGAISGNSKKDAGGKNALTASLPYDPNLRLEPPLGNLSDQLALVQAVKDGAIDAIAIDHNPHTYEEKTVAFADSPPGAIGLELALSLLWHGLVETGEFSALELWRVLSAGPAVCLGQTPATVAPGASAELILFDPEMSWTVDGQSLKSRSANTPWLGQQLAGKVVQSWIY
ncbi:dihydroorotase [Microcoleus sp. F8-D3]